MNLFVRYVHSTGKLEPSLTTFEVKPPWFITIPLKILSALKMVKLTYDNDKGYINSTTNLTLLNVLLVFFGTMDERTLAKALLLLQSFCSILAFVLRYGMSNFVY